MGELFGFEKALSLPILVPMLAHTIVSLEKKERTEAEEELLHLCERQLAYSNTDYGYARRLYSEGKDREIIDNWKKEGGALADLWKDFLDRNPGFKVGK